MTKGSLRAEACPLFVPLFRSASPGQAEQCMLPTVGFTVRPTAASDRQESLACKKRIDALEFPVLHAKFNALILHCSKFLAAQI
jgi:hypothetical protein